MIDYRNIADSIEFYENKGFKRIESPWTVTKAISNITRPIDKQDDFFIPAKNKTLVGSGEQSFLYLFLKGFLPPGSYQTVTPCFRDEVFDDLHTKYFMKNELIVTDDVSRKRLIQVAQNAAEFFCVLIGEPYNHTLQGSIFFEWHSRTELDIVYNHIDERIELGSYGIRSCSFLKWIYGTGCAEPRLSHVINLHNGLSRK